MKPFQCSKISCN